MMTAFSFQSNAQTFKVGYVNLELVLAYMPEMKAANQTLAVFQQKLEEDLQTRQRYLESKYQEYVQLAQEGGEPDVLKAMEAEITRLDQEVKQKAADSEQKLMDKREQLLAPLSEKIQKEIDALAAEEGYDLILNSVDGTGNSIVLFSKDKNEVSEKLLARLGVALPSEQK